MQLPLKLAQVAAAGPTMRPPLNSTRPPLNWRPPVAEVALDHNRCSSLWRRWRTDLRTTRDMRKPERMQARSVLTKKAQHTANTHMIETRDT